MATYYVDFSATNNGDGSAYTQAASGGAVGAFNTIFSLTLTSGDIVWMRRVAKSAAFTSTQTLAYAGVTFIGWPESGDDFYSTRPSPPQTTWDADAGNYATFTLNTASTNLTINAASMLIYRLQVLCTSASASALSFGTVSGNTFKNCWFANNQSVTVSLISITNATNTEFDNCEFSVTTYNNSSSAIFSSLTTCAINNCQIDITNLNGTSSASLIQMSTSSVIRNLTFNVGTMNSSATLIFIFISNTGNTIINCTITVTTNTATGNATVLQINTGENSNIVRNLNCNVGYNFVISGSGNDIQVNKWTQTTANTTGAIQVSGSGNTLVFNNTTFKSGNTSGDIDITGAGNTIVTRNATYANTPFFRQSADLGNRWFSFDDGGTANLWKSATFSGTVNSSSVTRTGGEVYSILLTNTLSTSLSRGQMQLSQLGRETMWISCSSGARTITIYGAYKNYTTLLAHDIWIETEYRDGSIITQPVTTHIPNGALSSDSSTWVGDSGLTMFKMVLSFTLSAAQIVPLRIYGLKYQSSAYLYIDPLPVVT